MLNTNSSINHLIENTHFSSINNHSNVSVTKDKKYKSIQMLGLLASLSSMGVVVPFQQSATAKTTIFDENGATLIAELPSLDNNLQTLAAGEKLLASEALINPNFSQELTEREVTQIPSLVAQTPKKAVNKKVYTVQPGDTISGIARKYGISSNQIINANQLTNPNFIKINRLLVIPNIDLANANNSPKITASSQPTVIASTKDREVSISNNFASSDSKTSGSLSSLVEKKAESRSKKQSRETVANTDSENDRVANSQTTRQNPYISKLRQDIVKLRTKYQQQNGSSEIATARTNIEPIEQSVSQKNPAKTTSETNISKTNISETNVIRKKESVAIESSNFSASSEPIASAPLPAENVNLLISLSKTNTEIPDLPPLASPEEYLPDNQVFDGYLWPAKGTLTSGYGWRWGRMHKGIDIAAPIGTPIVAAAPGEVIFAGWNSGGYGNLVKLRHPDGSVTFYAHNNRVVVRSGQRVRQGQLIAEMGSTGRSTGPHLHFEIRPNGSTAINPMARLPKR